MVNAEICRDLNWLSKQGLSVMWKTRDALTNISTIIQVMLWLLSLDILTLKCLFLGNSGFILELFRESAHSWKFLLHVVPVFLIDMSFSSWFFTDIVAFLIFTSPETKYIFNFSTVTYFWPVSSVKDLSKYCSHVF